MSTWQVAASTKDICVSNAVRQQGRDLRIAPLNKLVVVRNGIDPTPFITAAENGARVEFRNKMGYLDGQLVIGNTGRLAQQKDNKTLIESMAIFKARNPQIPFVLLLAGDGPDRKALEDLTASLKLTDEVRFLGFVSNIPQFLAGLDIFISPSLWEGLSISLLEAMAAAKPIITTSILPNAELIEHEVNGLIVSPRQPEQIAEALLRLVQDTQLAKNFAAVARKDVLENFTIDRMFEETLELY